MREEGVVGPVVSIVGGGWSFGIVDPKKLPGTVIAVNDAAFYLSSVRPADIIVSMDRLWIEYRWYWLAERRAATYLRRSACKNVAYPDGVRDDWLSLFENDAKGDSYMTDMPGWLNGDNSGKCAINLAYQLKPSALYLFGFDMCRSPDGRAYWHEPYPWAPQGGTKPGKYRQWATEFGRHRAQFNAIGCAVTNVSMSSMIDAFQKVPPALLGMDRKAAVA